MGFGLLGTNPFSLGKYFSSAKISYSSKTNFQDFTKLTPLNGTAVFIISFFTQNMIGNCHTIAVKYDSSLGSEPFVAYKLYSDDTQVRYFNSFSSIMTNNYTDQARFIIGYRLY